MNLLYIGQLVSMGYPEWDFNEKKSLGEYRGFMLTQYLSPVFQNMPFLFRPNAAQSQVFSTSTSGYLNNSARNLAEVISLYKFEDHMLRWFRYSGKDWHDHYDKCNPYCSWFNYKFMGIKP